MRILRIISIILFVVCVSNVYAADTVRQLGGGYNRQGQGLQIATFVITSDGGDATTTSFLKPDDILGWHIMTVEMYSATDDAFTVTITTDLGSEVFAYTTTAATTGHLRSTTDRWPIYSTPKIKVTSLTSAESCTIVVTFVR